jgi:HlyD family secretion protein
VVAVGGIVAANLARGRKKGVEVTMHTVKKDDVIARVTCTGKVEAKKKVEISANVMGQIVNLAVKEGDRVEKGQFLLQIDRAQLQAQASGSEANLSALLAERDATRASLEQAQDVFNRADKNFRERIISEADLLRARTALDGARAGLAATERRIEQARAGLAASRDTLSKTTILAPIGGLVTALPVEEGEIAVIGTMNNAGTKLMTISDMSEVQAEMEVDETDLPRVKLGQKATVTIDAFPDRTFSGTVTEIASSPIVRQGQSNPAVEFSVKVVIVDPSPEIRPGFSVSGAIETGEQKGVVAIPVQALVVQDMAEKTAKSEAAEEEVSTRIESKKPAARDIEGVFKVEEGKVRFVAVKTGLQGELVIEITEGLKEGDQIFTGPFRTLRALKEGDLVRPEAKPGGKGDKSAAKA